jgi:hypothetical protein
MRCRDAGQRQRISCCSSATQRASRARQLPSNSDVQVTPSMLAAASSTVPRERSRPGAGARPKKHSCAPLLLPLFRAARSRAASTARHMRFAAAAKPSVRPAHERARTPPRRTHSSPPPSAWRTLGKPRRQARAKPRCTQTPCQTARVTARQATPPLDSCRRRTAPLRVYDWVFSCTDQGAATAGPQRRRDRRTRSPARARRTRAPLERRLRRCTCAHGRSRAVVDIHCAQTRANRRSDRQALSRTRT